MTPKEKAARLTAWANPLGNHYFYRDSFNRALLYYDSALQLKKLEADDLASVIRNKGAIFVETGRLDSAFANFQYGLNAFEKMGDQREIADIHFNLGRIYAEKGDYKAAIQQYEKSLEMLEALQLPALRSNVLLHLSIAHQEEGELRKALRYNNQHLLLRDSLEQNMVAGLNQEVNRFNGVVNIMVEDDGRGFDLERAVNDGGMGLKSVESRVNKLDGELKIDTAKGRGTTVMIDIPVQEN